MNITLYKYSNRTLIANKLADESMIAVWSGDITPYGEFDSSKVVFRLSEKYEANYCRYEYNGNTYYGFCTVSADSKGLYTYNITVDALSTCWYDGCFDLPVLVLRKTGGTSVSADDGIPWQDTMDKIQHNITNRSNGCHILVQCVWQDYDYSSIYQPTLFESIRSFHELEGLPSNIRADHMLYSLGLITYVLTPAQWSYFCTDFLSSLKDAAQNKIGLSILKVGIIDSLSYSADINAVAPFAFGVSPKNAPASGKYHPCIIYPEEDGKFKAAPISDTWIDPDNPPGFNDPMWARYYIHFLEDWRYLQKLTKDSDLDSPITLSCWEQYILQFFYPGNPSAVLINIRDIDTSYFVNNQIVSVGYEVAFDPGSWVLTFYPRINGNTLYEYPSQHLLGTIFPLVVDTSITNWTGITTNILVSAASLVATVLTGGRGAYWTAGLIGSTASGIGGAIGQIANGLHQEAAGGYVVKGASGGNLEWTTGTGAYVIIYKQIPIEKTLSNYNLEFGKPHGQVEIISRTPGYERSYFLTQGAKLLTNGLPLGIIREAEGIINNSGMYLIA